MTWPFLAAALVRGIGLAGLALVVGGLALQALLPAEDAAAPAVARARLRRVRAWGLAALALATLADLPLRAQAMSQAPLAGAVAAVPDVLRQTHFGTVWMARGGALALALPLALAGGRAARAALGLALAVVAATTTLTGHAADRGDLTLVVAADLVHVLAASAWAGGLAALALIVAPGAGAWSPPSLAGLARRFSRLAGACLLAVVVTGTYGAWGQLGGLAALWATAYGRWLLLKLSLVAALAWLGAVNRYVVIPRLGPGARPAGPAARLVRLMRLVLLGPRPASGSGTTARFAGYLGREAALGLAVFACTAVLGEVTPGRHAWPERRVATHVTAKDLLLRRAADATGGGTVTPPRGDAARGRAVFERLKCHDCHAVGGERFPAPRRPGPDLTGIGRRHPGYLVESIMNPDAMIVDGPGFTGLDGASTMPDYRARLTVGELINLVEFLGSVGARPTLPSE